jgi:hypothetical protein
MSFDVEMFFLLAQDDGDGEEAADTAQPGEGFEGHVAFLSNALAAAPFAARFLARTFASASRLALSRRLARCSASATSVFLIRANILGLIAISYGTSCPSTLR